MCPIGWQEWAALPDLGYDRLKVKIDTGAKTCSLHAWKIQREGIVEDESGQPMPLLRIRLDADPESPGKTKDILAPMIRCSLVTDTSGRKERRPVILTRLVLGSFEQIVEVNITNREAMRFRMLIGRTALCPHFVVDVNREYLLGPPRPHSRGSQCAYGARL
ncbi:MAG: hypothetical protein BWZ10_01501 [candidate division BRC1 bacterium ADurb.BinA364]|nr:MAG: hypothetical protein BWZ10_01501 [candidate division BRC1 bacterium ADurb.BinA364]